MITIYSTSWRVDFFMKYVYLDAMGSLMRDCIRSKSLKRSVKFSSVK